MSLTLDGTSGITSSGGTNVLQADAVITSNLVNGAVTTAKIADLGVTEGKLAANAVTTAKITDSNVTTAKIANSAVTIAKLSATGTPSSTTFLRGDGSWQTIETTPTTAQVLTATAGASVGAVGTYAFLGLAATNTAISENSTIAGSSLRYLGSNIRVDTGGSNSGTSVGGTPSGTWRAMGHCQASGNASNRAATVFLRIS
jgi:hypothetical protein